MSNGRISFEIEGTKHTLYFGMSAIEIFSRKSVNELGRLAKENPETPIKDLKADGVKSFAYIIYAGLCNQADIKELDRPSFSEAYELSEEILYQAEDLQNDIVNCFNESRANKLLQEKLHGKEKKSEVEAEK